MITRKDIRTSQHNEQQKKQETDVVISKVIRKTQQLIIWISIWNLKWKLSVNDEQGLQA